MLHESSPKHQLLFCDITIGLRLQLFPEVEETAELGARTDRKLP